MLPSRFEYHRPATLDEALQALASLEDAKVLAGGQSLIPVMKLRFAAPANLVDINLIPGLDGIEDDGGGLRLGALVRHNQIAVSSTVAARSSLLASAAPQIADPLVRNLGSVGGSLAHADPAGDWGAVMLATGASVVLTSSRGERTMPVSEFLIDVFTTALTGVGTKNTHAVDAEASLAGAEPSEAAFAEAGRLAAAAASPVADVRGSVEYKRQMVEVFVRRGLTTAAAAAVA